MANKTVSEATKELLNQLGFSLGQDLAAIQSEWDGDSKGELEDRALAAEEIGAKYSELLELIEEL